MRTRKLRTALFLTLYLTLLFQLPVRVLAQGSVAKEALDEWFYSRLLWGVATGAIIGVVAGVTHLCRLRFEINALNVNSQARRKFLLWLVIISVVSAILLFLDAWLLYPFSAISLEFWEALTQIWLNYRMLAVLAATLAMFTCAVAIATRLKSDCRCRYAFLPGPRGK